MGVRVVASPVILGPVACSTCGCPVEWQVDGQWHDASDGPLHACSFERQKPKVTRATVDDAKARQIIRQVSLVYGVRPEDIRGRTRRLVHVQARADAVFRMWRGTSLTLGEIGVILDNRDRSSVSYLLSRARVSA